MATYTWNAVPGAVADWSTRVDWLGGVAPNMLDASVVFPRITDSNGTAAAYVVSVAAGEAFTVATLSVGSTLSIAGAVAALSTVSLAGGAIDMDGGTLTLAALADGNGIDIQGSGTLASAGTIVNAGLIVGGGLTVSAAGFDNTGTLDAEAGGLTLRLTGGGAGFANLAGGMLAGGWFRAASGTLSVVGVGAISTDASTITLDGPAAAIQTVGGGTTVALQSSLSTIAADGVLALRSARFTAANALDIAGTLSLAAASTLSAPSLALDAGGLVSGNGTIAGPLTGTGTILATGGLLDVGSTGAAALRIAAGTLELAGAAAGTVTFQDTDATLATSTLVLDDPAAFTGTIVGLNTLAATRLGTGPGSLVIDAEQVVLPGISVASIRNQVFTRTAQGGTLSFQTGTSTIALAFAFAFPAGTLSLAAGPQPYSNTPPSVVITEPIVALAGVAPSLSETAGSASHTIYGAQDNATIALAGGDQTITLVGSRETVSAGGAGNDLVVGMQGASTVTLGDGYHAVVAFGTANTISVGNAGTAPGALGTLSYINAGSGANTLTAGNGTNVINTGGFGDSIATGNGLNLIFATSLGATTPGAATLGGGAPPAALGAPGHTTLTLGSGSNFAYLHGEWNRVVEGGGTDAIWGGTVGGDSFMLSPAGGVLFVENFVVGDVLDLTRILAGVPLAADLSNIGSFVAVAGRGADDAVFGVADGGSKTVLRVSGASATAYVNLENVGSVTVPGLLARGALVV